MFLGRSWGVIIYIYTYIHGSIEIAPRQVVHKDFIKRHCLFWTGGITRPVAMPFWEKNWLRSKKCSK